MQAIEFKTTIHNGIISIPPEYLPQWEGKTVRIIVLEDSQPIENISSKTQKNDEIR